MAVLGTDGLPWATVWSIFWVNLWVKGLVSVASIALMRQIPESAPLAGRPGRTDWAGIISMAVGLAALLIVVTQGSSIGWANLATWALIAVFLVAFGVFVNAELKASHPLVDFKLFTNTVFTGATISNFLINGTAGALTVSLWVLQGAAGMSAATAGYLTAGYAIFIIAFIRVGEKLLQRFGPRKPMLWGCLIVLLSILLLMATHTLQWQYAILAVIAYSLFGLGLAFYATPSTDAALANLPLAQSGSGAGIYKMASSLGAAMGVAISGAIFATLGADDVGVRWLEGVITFVGRQDNLALREAAMVALGFNLFMVLVAIASIMLTIPKGRTVQAG